MGEGKETCLETRDKMVNIKKSCLDWDSDDIKSASTSDQLITTQLNSTHVRSGRAFHCYRGRESGDVFLHS